MKRPVVLPAMLLLVGLYGWQTFAQNSQMQSAALSTARQRLSALAFPALPLDEPVKCGLGMLGYATRHRPELSIDMQRSLVLIFQRMERQKSITVGHFTVHYDTAGPEAAAMLDASYQEIPGTADEYADSVAAIANQVFAFETGELGYKVPETDGEEGGGPEYDIYVEGLSNEYGETVPETQLDTKPDGARWTSFMRIDNDFSFVRPNSNKGLPALRVTLAHEFHHVIQLGAYGYWTADADKFFHEVTSTWMEDVVFPGVNDYLNYVRSSRGHFKNPDLCFSLSNGLIEYSRCIWGHFIAAKFGRDLMRVAWQNIPNARPLQAMDLALQGVASNPSNFKIEFLDWEVWNYYTGPRADSTKYYPRGADYPEVVQIPYEFVPPTGMLLGDLESLSTRYHQVLTTADTVILIQTNINRESAEQGTGSSYPYSIYLSSSQTDESYEQAGSVLFYKASVADPSNWKTMKIVNGVATYSGFADGVPFPNPFRPTGKGLLFIPAQADQGTLNIYSSSMDLIFSASETAVVKFGKRMFTWDGYTRDNSPARSGVYLFVLSIPGNTITGKIALIRK
jgi:hypothetical protein